MHQPHDFYFSGLSSEVIPWTVFAISINIWCFTKKQILIHLIRPLRVHGAYALQWNQWNENGGNLSMTIIWDEWIFRIKASAAGSAQIHTNSYGESIQSFELRKVWWQDLFRQLFGLKMMSNTWSSSPSCIHNHLSLTIVLIPSLKRAESWCDKNWHNNKTVMHLQRCLFYVWSILYKLLFCAHFYCHVLEEDHSENYFDNEEKQVATTYQTWHSLLLVIVLKMLILFVTKNQGLEVNDDNKPAPENIPQPN